MRSLNPDNCKQLWHRARRRVEVSAESTPRCVALLPHLHLERDRFAVHLWGGWLCWTVLFTWWRKERPILDDCLNEVAQ